MNLSMRWPTLYAMHPMTVRIITYPRTEFRDMAQVSLVAVNRVDNMCVTFIPKHTIVKDLHCASLVL